MNTEMNNSPEKDQLSGAQDLPDSPHDEERMQPEETTLDLPDVSDIPGQENIVVPSLGELADTTISSDDEEGIGLFDDEEADDETAIVMGTEADISGAEKSLLQRTDEDMPTEDDTNLRAAELDEQDPEGDFLNEGGLATDVSGADLDTSGHDEDDANENIGEEDEENNTYSLGGDSKDNLEETED